jgi:hypothetical protein
VPAVHAQHAEHVVDLARFAERIGVEEADDPRERERGADYERISLSW